MKKTAILSNVRCDMLLGTTYFGEYFKGTDSSWRTEV